MPFHLYVHSLTQHSQLSKARLSVLDRCPVSVSQHPRLAPYGSRKDLHCCSGDVQLFPVVPGRQDSIYGPHQAAGGPTDQGMSRDRRHSDGTDS